MGCPRIAAELMNTTILLAQAYNLLAQATTGGGDSTLGAPCQGGGFFAFPTWYKYLPGKYSGDGVCRPALENIYDFWLVLAAVIDILLRLAALAAVVFVVWGGIKYIQSRGEPQATKEAQQTIINSIVGMVIAVSASAVIGFIASRFN